MKPTLQVRLSQHLALTPQLQQSIRLLQLSTLELHQEVAQMLEQNPFLEAEDEGLAPDIITLDAPPAEASGMATEPEGRDTDGAEALDEIRADEFGTPARDDWENGTEGDDFDGIRETPPPARDHDRDDTADASDRRGGEVALAEHLRGQLPGMRLSADDRVALEALIDSLDDNGYLADALEDIAARLVELTGHAADSEARQEVLERLQCALRWLQSLDPAGVGARSLAECLCLQLRTRPRGPARVLALRICEQHLELLARRDTRRLTALTGASETLVRQAHALIIGCEPKPGRPFGATASPVIVPDVVVRRSGRGLSVTLNPDVMPRLRINDLYAQAARAQRGAPGHAGLGARLQEARWFVKNIQQRFDTILRASRAIVERQKAFFTHGAIAMKPLVLREIADELGLHESTISRVTTAKYMATPQGTFELKYFFGSGLATEAGGSASSTAVRALIQQLVAAENAARPLSDSQIGKLLEEQGIQVARRTVAKYREALKIAPASQRKSV